MRTGIAAERLILYFIEGEYTDLWVDYQELSKNEKNYIESIRKSNLSVSAKNLSTEELETLCRTKGWIKSCKLSAQAIIAFFQGKNGTLWWRSDRRNEFKDFLDKVKLVNSGTIFAGTSIDKWNPSDIWFEEPNAFRDFLNSEEIQSCKEGDGEKFTKELNRWFDSGKIQGISLKKLSDLENEPTLVEIDALRYQDKQFGKEIRVSREGIGETGYLEVFSEGNKVGELRFTFEDRNRGVPRLRVHYIDENHKSSRLGSSSIARNIEEEEDEINHFIAPSTLAELFEKYNGDKSEVLKAVFEKLNKNGDGKRLNNLLRFTISQYTETYNGKEMMSAKHWLLY